MAMRLAGPLAARFRAARSATSGGLRLLGGGGGGHGIDASSSSTRSHAPSSRRSYSSGEEGEFPSGYSKGEFPSGYSKGEFPSGYSKGHFPRIIYPQGFKAAEESERLDRLMDRLDNIVDRKEGVTVIATYNIGQKQKDWESVVESALARQKLEFDAALISQRMYYEEKLSEVKKELNDKINECTDKITEADTTSKLLTQKYDFFKDNNDERIKNVQYGVVKCIGGVITFVGGAALTYMRLKDHIKGGKNVKDWFN
ncbi:unnamed protein product [Urochloa humidicola]